MVSSEVVNSKFLRSRRRMDRNMHAVDRRNRQHAGPRMSSGRQRRCWLAQSSLASPAWCLRFVPVVLTSLLLASEAARSQQFGPGVVNTPIASNNNITVVGSTDLRPPAGQIAVSPGGNANVLFDPNLVRPGPITVVTQGDNAIALRIGAGNQLFIKPNNAPIRTTITTTGTNAFGINIVSANHLEVLNNVIIRTSGTGASAIKVDNPNNEIRGNNVTLTTTGANASALALLSGASLASFTNSRLRSAAGPVILVDGGGIKTINLIDSSVTGAVITNAGSTSNVTLLGTTWRLTGDSNVTNLTNSASEILFSRPVNGAFKTLTTVNYNFPTLATGGTIRLNTFLGTDGSPS